MEIRGAGEEGGERAHTLIITGWLMSGTNKTEQPCRPSGSFSKLQITRLGSAHQSSSMYVCSANTPVTQVKEMSCMSVWERNFHIQSTGADLCSVTCSVQTGQQLLISWVHSWVSYGNWLPESEMAPRHFRENCLCSTLVKTAFYCVYSSWARWLWCSRLVYSYAENHSQTGIQLQEWNYTPGVKIG